VKKIMALGVAMLLGVAAAGVAIAQSGKPYPTVKPIRIVLNVSPGGGSDVMIRRLQSALESDLGQTVVIENRPGGGSAAQMSEITRAPADGYTIGTVTGSHLGAFHQTLKQFNVDSIDWVVGLVSEPYVLAVPATSDIKSLADIVDIVNNKNKDLVIGGFTRGSGGHVTWEMFTAEAKLRPKAGRWVPYDSVGDAVVAALGNHVDVVVAYAGLVRDHVEAGKLRVIGVLAANRLKALPEGPTFAEQGFKLNVGWQQFRGLIAPKGTPADIQERISTAVEHALKDPVVVKYLDESSLTEAFMPPKQFATYVHEQDGLTKEWIERLRSVQ
jgi:tripartite-type tricarboxylate transporter receptor subunit TctC